MNGYTKCRHCLRCVRVANGLLCRHIKHTWDKEQCPGFKTEAKWVDGNKLNAFGRNPQGFCMACHGHISDGENPECHQCCYEKRIEND